MQADLAAKVQAYLLWSEERGLVVPSRHRHPDPEQRKGEGPLAAEEVLSAAPAGALAQDDKERPAAARSIKVCFVADELSADDKDLLSKMATAMGLSVGDYTVTNVGPEIESLPRCQAIIALGEVANDALKSKTLVTIHPRDLRRQPALKRQAWQDLQTVMAKLAPKADA